MNGVGLILIVLYPGAFVDFREELSDLPLLKQLKVYCAGVWHNLVLCLFCWLLLWKLPLFLLPFYKSVDDGVIVVGGDEIEKNDGVLRSHFHIGDKISWLGTCKIDNTESWTSSFDKACYLMDSYCIPNNNVSFSNTNENLSMFCFDEITSETKRNHVYCVSNPKPFLNRNNSCNESRDCNSQNSMICGRYRGPNELYSKLTPIEKEDGSVVITNGNEFWLRNAIKVSSLQSRFQILSHQLFTPNLPDKIGFLLDYTIALSSALSLLNIAPMFYLDGQWAFTAFLKLYNERCIKHQGHRMAQTTIHTISNISFYLTSFLLLTNIALSTISLFFF